MKHLPRLSVPSTPVLAFAGMLLAGIVAASVTHATGSPLWGGLGGLSIALVAAMPLAQRERRRRALYRALAGTVASYRDGDFSFGLSGSAAGDLGELVAAHNALGEVLRQQRTALVQRELLLDTVVQNTPVALVLVDPAGRVVLGNLAARRLFDAGRRLEGQMFAALIERCAEPLRVAMDGVEDAVFSLGGGGDEEELFHLSRRGFRLNGRPHQLVLLRQLTAELRRQEVRTWKKVIRVISHELNNSLAPIASLAHSSGEMLRRGRAERLPDALAVIEERARHLEGFIRDYARFAKLPAPRREATTWRRFLDALNAQMTFSWNGAEGESVVRFDSAQMQQAMLNLLKNAHESGSAAAAIEVAVQRLPGQWRIDVLDRGSGMNEATMAQGLLPFYSTKRHGSGLGLALAREIAEAHGGTLALANRDGGGLRVTMVLADLT